MLIGVFELLADARAQIAGVNGAIESLRDFFVRTGVEWQEIVLHAMKFRRLDEIAERSVKEVRKTAFARAETRWWDVREEVQALEDEQEAAGIQEVVSLAERGGGNGEGGAPKRR